MLRILVWLLLSGWSGILEAAPGESFLPTFAECQEGSDFIKNAALSRDNGYTQKKIVGRFDEDVMVLSGVDPQKRWFIRSPGAILFLRQALLAVFQTPRSPLEQSRAFLAACKEQVLKPEDL